MRARLSAVVALAALVLLSGGPGGARADLNLFGVYYDNVARAARAERCRPGAGLLVASGSNPNQTDEEQRTGLHIAAMNGNLSDHRDPDQGQRQARCHATSSATRRCTYAADRNQAEAAQAAARCRRPGRRREQERDDAADDGGEPRQYRSRQRSARQGRQCRARPISPGATPPAGRPKATARRWSKPSSGRKPRNGREGRRLIVFRKRRR